MTVMFALFVFFIGAVNAELAELANAIELLFYSTTTIALTILAYYINPYAPLYFFILWLPIQTGLLSYFADTEIVSDALIRYLSAIKEVIAVCWALLIIVKRPRGRPPLCFPDWVALAIVIMASIYLFIPDAFFGRSSTTSQRIFGFRTALVPYLAYLLGRTIQYKSSSVKKSIWLLIIICSAVTIFGIFELILIPREDLISGLIPYFILKGGDPSSYNSDTLSYIVSFGGIKFKRMMSSFLSPLGLAYFLIFPVALALSIKRYKFGVTRYFKFVLLFMLIIPVVLSNTRAVIACALLMFIIAYGADKLYKLVIIIITTSIIIYFTPINSIVTDTVKVSDSSSKAHLFAYVVGTNQILRNPLGIGLGQAGPNAMSIAGGESLYSQQDPTVYESLYLTMATEQGILSVVIFIMFILSITISTRSCLKNELIDVFDKFWISSVPLATIGFFVASIPTEHWYGFQSAFIYWWFVGLAVQRVSFYKREAIS